MMPLLDGFGLLRRAAGPIPSTERLPVILLSARAGEEAKVEGLEAGADDYIVKPFSARELLARVWAALHLARVRAERRRGRSQRQARAGAAAGPRLASQVPAPSDGTCGPASFEWTTRSDGCSV